MSSVSLPRHFLFEPLSNEQLAKVEAKALSITLEAEQVLFNAGDVAQYFYLLASGQMQLYRLSPAGEEKVIEIIHPAQTFAEAVMFLNAPVYPVSSRAVFDSMLWRIDMGVFREILLESNELCMQLLAAMSRRLHGAIQDIEQLTLQNANRRVVQLLLQCAPDAMSLQYQVEWDTPKQVLASRLSVRPETFSRILQQLSRKGLIAVQGRQVDILNAQLLRQELVVT